MEILVDHGSASIFTKGAGRSHSKSTGINGCAILLDLHELERALSHRWAACNTTLVRGGVGLSGTAAVQDHLNQVALRLMRSMTGRCLF